MADTKITGLAAIGANPIIPSTFPLPMVDLTDTSMAASGTTKKVTVNQILGAGGIATLASASITGDLTVDTSTLKVDSTNNRVGIGTASPTVPLYVQGNNATATAIIQDETNGAKLRMLANSINFDITNGGGGGEIAVSGANPITFRTNSSERARIDGSGNLGLGVTPSAWGAAFKAAQLTYGAVYSQAFTVAGVGANCYNAGAGGWQYFGSGQAASRYEQSSGSHAWYNAVSGSGAITFTQAMTLTADGELLVGTTSAPLTGGGVRIKNSGGTVGEIALANNSGSADYVARFFWGSTSTLVGNITVSSTATAFNTSSDYRLKEMVQPMVDALSRVLALKPVSYKWKSDKSDGEGFIAHELAEVVPLAVTGEKDSMDSDGKIKPQTVDYSKVVAVLTAALQELTARVIALENK